MSDREAAAYDGQAALEAWASWSGQWEARDSRIGWESFRAGWRAGALAASSIFERIAPSEWEYGWAADESIRQSMNPRGPKILLDGTIGTPEELARFPRGQRIRRRKAGPWESVNE